MTCCPRLLSRRYGLCAQILLWAEYCQHETALQGNVFSNKQDPLERQFERFNQANTILKSRDLGSIICDIKFSELTYLDAFWRDYINGSLLEALKGVFITDSLKQAVGHEAIKLLVNVDEEDYELGRQKLLRNLMLQALPRPFPASPFWGLFAPSPLELTLLFWGLFSTLSNQSRLFFFLRKRQRKVEVLCVPALPAPMCLGFPVSCCHLP